MSGGTNRRNILWANVAVFTQDEEDEAIEAIERVVTTLGQLPGGRPWDPMVLGLRHVQALLHSSTTHSLQYKMRIAGGGEGERMYAESLDDDPFVPEPTPAG